MDRKIYREKRNSKGIGLSYTPGSAVGISGGKGKRNTDNHYKNVTNQSGIYAGKEGFDIEVKNNTRLKGAVIDSQAEKEPDHHRYFDMGKHRQQSRVQNRRTRNILQWENRERR